MSKFWIPVSLVQGISQRKRFHSHRVSPVEKLSREATGGHKVVPSVSVVGVAILERAVPETNAYAGKFTPPKIDVRHPAHVEPSLVNAHILVVCPEFERRSADVCV